MKIKVLSWNIWFDCHFDEICDFLKNTDADIIGFQEVVTNDADRDIISFMAKLGYAHTFSLAGVTKSTKSIKEGREFGNAVFTKHKIIRTQTYVLSEDPKKVAAVADIQIGSEVFHVVSAHLLHTHQVPSEIQEAQARKILELIPKKNVIVMGDFNATPTSNAISIMKGGLNDADPKSNPTWCLYKDGCPICSFDTINTRLDYIFLSKDLRFGDFKVEDAKGSDHLPVSVEVEV